MAFKGGPKLMPSALLALSGCSSAAAQMGPQLVASSSRVLPPSVLPASSGGSQGEALALPTETTGCMVYGQSVRPKLGAEIWQVESRLHCQAECQKNPECGRFRYHEDTKGCQLAPQNSWFINDGHCMGTYGDNRCVAGPRTCDLIPRWCNEVPDATTFPADTQLESNQAWQTGIQPPNMQCWPHGSNQWPRLCTEEPPTVLEDSQKGWSGLCQGLRKVDTPEGKSCADLCKEDLWCSEWALVNTWKNEHQCWVGLGNRCYKSHGYEGQLVQAQRIMHGHYRVLRDLRYAEVSGLVHVDITNDEGIAATAETDGITRCKNTCLSLVNCQIWIYHKSSGCWIEWPYKHRIKYPATSASWGIAGSQDVIAGEYMQRVCGNLSGDVTSAPVPPAPVPAPPAIAGPLPTVCEPNNTAPLTEPCQCASNVDSNECMMGKYCWEGNTCSDIPKPDGRTMPDDNTDGVGVIPGAETMQPESHLDDIVRIGALVLMFLLCFATACVGILCMTGRFGGRSSSSSAGTLVLAEVDDYREQEDEEEQPEYASPMNFFGGAIRPSAPSVVTRSVPLMTAGPPPVASSTVAYANYPRAGAQQQQMQGVYAPVATTSASSPSAARGAMVEVPAGTPGAFPMMENRSGGLVALPTLRLGGARDPGPPKVCRCGNVFMPDAVFCRKCGEPRSVFDMIDTNHDGFVTKEEWDRFGMGP